MTFLHQSLEALLPRGEVSECNGQQCILDKTRQPRDGDRVLVSMAGMCDWARVVLNPQRIITDDGFILEGELLEDVYIPGVVTHEIVQAWDDDKPCI